ncbi:hypothetical protein [Siphonobacter sp. SORGH_AS_1065]|uniref:hypothetical protein n=1 Tax=Siphonobacter sp. SORGH_AS_1065 TaxID=3041795 RepID=UPI0027D7EA85|nr:hypothetical protein [Siphonobacter sp. SORGH_AS_1065]
MLARSGKATADEVDEARRIHEALRAYQIPEAGQQQLENPESESPKPEIILPRMSETDFMQTLEKLTAERHQAHKQMCLLSNTLGNYPDSQNLKDLVDEIEAFKLQRNTLGERIDYLKANGRLPEAEPQRPADLISEQAKTAYLANLPADRYEVHKLLNNSLMPNLSKARKNAIRAKNDVTRQKYEIKAAQLEAQVDIARRQLEAMS